MPKLKTKSGAKKRFKLTGTGKVVYAKAGKHPAMIGVAVGAIADPDFQAPLRSVWEQTMHKWVKLPDDAQHFPRGRT